MISLNFAGLLQHSTQFLMMSPKTCYFLFQHNGWRMAKFCEFLMFWVKNWPFYGQFGPKYDEACILDEIIYHFINFRKSLNVGIGQF